MSKEKITKNPLLILLVAAILIVALFILIKSTNKTNKQTETINIGESEAKVEETNIALDNGLVVTKIGKYSGTFMEDASDEKVENILAILVTNNGEKTLQYAEITLSIDAQESSSDSALFKLSTLNPGETVMVLESNRKAYDEAIEYTTATAQNVVFFNEELTTYEAQLQIQPLDGGFNITNISEEDITGEIMVYFKDCKDDMLYGGITYRGRIEGGLKAGEIRQIMTDNFTESNTKVMFITITDLEQ